VKARREIQEFKKMSAETEEFSKELDRRVPDLKEVEKEAFGV
jgi:hypothetical protein